MKDTVAEPLEMNNHKHWGLYLYRFNGPTVMIGRYLKEKKSRSQISIEEAPHSKDRILLLREHLNHMYEGPGRCGSHFVSPPYGLNEPTNTELMGFMTGFKIQL